MSQQPTKATASEQQTVAQQGNIGRAPRNLNRDSAQGSSNATSQTNYASTVVAESSGRANGADVGKPFKSWADRARAAGANGAAQPPAGTAQQQENKEQQHGGQSAQPPRSNRSSGVTLPDGVSSKSEQIQFGDFKRGELHNSQPHGSQVQAPVKMATESGGISKGEEVQNRLNASGPVSSSSYPHKTGAADLPGSLAPNAGSGPSGKSSQQQHPRGFSTGGGRPRNPPHQPVPVATGYQQNALAYAAMNAMPFPMPAAYSYGTYSAAGYPNTPTGQYPFYPGQHTAGGVGGMTRTQPQVPIHVPQPAAPPTSSFAGGAPSSSSASTVPKPSTQVPTAPATRTKKLLKIENPDTHEVLDLEHVRDKRKEKEAADKKKEEASLPTKEDRTSFMPTSRSEGESAVPGETVKPELTEVKPPAENITPSFESHTQEGYSQGISPEKSAGDGISRKEEDASKTSSFPTKEDEDMKDESHKSPTVEKKAMTGASEASSVTMGDIAELADEANLKQEANEAPRAKLSYSKDFLLGLKDQCKTMPSGFEVGSAAELIPGETGAPRGLNGPASRDWKSTRMPGPPLTGPPGMRGRGPGRRPPTGPDADVWERGRALPPLRDDRRAPPGMRGPAGSLPALHKTGSAYRVGRVQSDDPEEERAQKALKSMLNKITPQNFEKITAQIVDKINERKKAKTLRGFIDQIFDKALAETTFSELYASLVAKLNPELPELEDENGKAVNFRRTLLNKCQEEFDRGALAMQAVAEREKRDGEKANDDEEERVVEEGEITEEQRQERENKAEAKRRDKMAAEEEVIARKRMLGNINFVGQLYRFGVLTEGVMHSCVRQLLEETQKPRPEDVECLCKLLSTIGRPMEASDRQLKSPTDEKVSAKDMMVVYFKRIQDLSENTALDARHRFMLKDLIELRNNGWVMRRKAEGPKKIEEIHRDAALERNRSQMMERQSSRGPRDIPRGPRVPLDRVDAPIRTMNRVSSQDSIGSQSLRPGGRPAPTTMRRTNSSSQSLEESSRSKPIPKMTIEDMDRKVKNLLEEMYNSGDIEEGVACVQELCEAKADGAIVVDELISLSLDIRGTKWEMLHKLLQKIVKADVSNLISPSSLESGIKRVLDKLGDTAVDAPLAPDHVADCLAVLIDTGFLKLEKIGEQILIADSDEVPEGEDTILIGDGYAIKLLQRLLNSLEKSWGEEKVKESWIETGLDAKSFLPAEDRAEGELPADLMKFSV